jgi:hypothetical protein
MREIFQSFVSLRLSPRANGVDFFKVHDENKVRNRNTGTSLSVAVTPPSWGAEGGHFSLKPNRHTNRRKNWVREKPAESSRSRRSGSAD